MFHRTICLTYKPGTAQADADGLLAAFAALPSQVRGLESASVIAPQEGFDACVDLAFATWQAREDCALDDFYQAALSLSLIHICPGTERMFTAAMAPRRRWPRRG